MLRARPKELGYAAGYPGRASSTHAAAEYSRYSAADGRAKTCQTALLGQPIIAENMAHYADMIPISHEWRPPYPRRSRPISNSPSLQSRGSPGDYGATRPHAQAERGDRYPAPRWPGRSTPSPWASRGGQRSGWTHLHLPAGGLGYQLFITGNILASASLLALATLA